MIQLFKDLLQPQVPDDPQAEVRLAAASLLLAMARADSDVDATEMDTASSALAKLLQLPGSAVAELIAQAEARVDDSVSLYDFTKILHQQQTKEEKVELIRLLWAVACADGSIDPHEELLVRKVAKLLYVPQADFIAAKRSAIAEYRDHPS